MTAHIEIFNNGKWVRAASIQVFGKDRCRIEYEADYIFGDNPAPLSLGMPVEFTTDRLGEDGQPDRRVPPFLYDMVPQGKGRRYLVNKLGLTDSDDLVLPLLVKGAFNSIGCLRIDEAVAFYQDEARANPVASQMDGFQINDIVRKSEAFLEHLSLHAMLAAGTTGVQGVAPKFLLTQDKNDQWFADLALADELASKHWLVKLPRGREKADLLVHRNEAAYLRVAKACGLRTNDEPILYGEMLFIRRFDRQVTTSGLQRLHQESLASAAGLRGFGVTTTQNDLLNALRKHVDNPLEETIEFLKRDVLNFALRNTDNHARNTALQRLPDGVVQLTPVFDFAPMFYDPEIVPRSVHWRDAKGTRLDGWQAIVESLDIDDAQKAATCQALRAFGDVVDKLESIAEGCGVDRVLLNQCLDSIARQARELKDLPASTVHESKKDDASLRARRPRV